MGMRQSPASASPHMYYYNSPHAQFDYQQPEGIPLMRDPQLIIRTKHYEICSMCAD